MCSNPYYVFLYLWGLGDSHGIASRKITCAHERLVIELYKVKFKICISKDYMLEACGWSRGGSCEDGIWCKAFLMAYEETIWSLHQVMWPIFHGHLEPSMTPTSSSSGTLKSKVLCRGSLTIEKDTCSRIDFRKLWYSSFMILEL